MREFSVPPAVTVADDTSMTDKVWANAAQYGDVAQFRRPGAGGWVDVTCTEFRDQVAALAAGMIAAGINGGDRVGLMSKTRYEWAVIDYAIWAAGGVTVPIYETSSAEQVEWILSDSGAVACFVETAEHASLIPALPQLQHIWQIDAGALAELTPAEPDLAAVEARRGATQAADVATIIYTSGTTGKPKGCVLTHRNLYSNAENALANFDSVIGNGGSTLLFLPLAHSLARMIQIAFVHARVTIGHTADVKNLLEDLKTFRPTIILSVPRVFEKVYNGAKQKAHADGKGKIFDKAAETAIAWSRANDAGGAGLGLRLKHTIFDKLVYSKLRAALGGQCSNAVSGGAPLGARLGHFFRGIGVTVYEGYGLTETAPVTNLNEPGLQRVGSVGRPIPGTTVRIGDDGEVLIKGPQVMKGYWNNPQATAEAITGEGWFHTGDIGEIDDAGFLTITGRKKELIVTAGGKNVAPAVLEDRVRAHALISQCVVIGDQQPFIAALIAIDEEALPKWLEAQGRTGALAELREDPALRAEVQTAVDDANKAVSHAEAIKVFRILPRDFSEATGELTPSMKVKRNVVHKEYASEIAAIYGA
ncbi:AMP-dependent synthetase/ligase [Longispora albida]|uniref:AMP-dependent synthetase/ligase n=1 Tax=Longispora albida TaxID=203523 RepID=UPI00036B5007|nr:long-chain fatty acid--CoA ligase [Longispora albida]